MYIPIFIASEKLLAPVGRIINSCMANLLPACEPPLITLNAGTGKTILPVGFPANSAKCLYRGRFLAAAPALATASETPKIALAPNLAIINDR